MEIRMERIYDLVIYNKLVQFIILTIMILRNKQPHKSSQTIIPDNSINPSKMPNKTSIQSIQTTRNTHNKLEDHRLRTQPQKWEITVPFQDEWEEIYNRRENYLNSMFNRRKTVLETISKKNRDIYVRITSQESHYSYSKKKEEKQDKPKHSIENLTANSRLMLTLSKHAMGQSNLHRLHPLREKETNIKINDQGENDGKIQKKWASKQLTPIIEHGEAPTAEPKIIESRYFKDEFSFNFCNKATGGSKLLSKTRGKSVGRARLADVFTNF